MFLVLQLCYSAILKVELHSILQIYLQYLLFGSSNVRGFLGIYAKFCLHMAYDCIPDTPLLPVFDSIHHSAPLKDPSTPIDSTILEDHFIDLPKDLFVFIPNDITNTPDLPNDITDAPDSLSIVPVIKSAHTSTPTPTSPILGDSLPRRSTRISRPPLTFRPINAMLLPQSILLPIISLVTNSLILIPIFAIAYMLFKNQSFTIKQLVIQIGMLPWQLKFRL